MHSKSAIDPTPRDVIKTTRWNNIRDAFGIIRDITKGAKVDMKGGLPKHGCLYVACKRAV
jgi:hypothetical protein